MVSKIAGIGSAHLSHNLHVKDVLCVPSFHVNLLSISQLTYALNCSIQIFSNFRILQDLASKRMISLNNQYKGLCYLVPPSTLVTYRVSTLFVIIWHKQLVHPSKAPS